MRFPKLWSLGLLLTCIPCHEFLISLPAFSSLFRLNGKGAKTPRDGRSADRNWTFLNWWPSIDTVKLFVVLLLISATFAEMRCIVSSSMCPTLQEGDRVIVEKSSIFSFNYEDFRVKQLAFFLLVSYYFRSPYINEIVTFQAPKSLQDLGYKKEDIFIKRIVAKAGDFVEVCQGVLFINGTAQRENFIAEDPAYRVRAIHVPIGHVYVMGDNRNNSCDSHVWGPLPVANIMGRYVVHFSGWSQQYQ